MNELSIVNDETPEVPRQTGMSRLTITSWLCLLWVFVAFCTFWETIDNIDVDGATKERYLPYEPLITGVVFTGLATVPIGFGCGLWALLFRYRTDYGLPLLPTLVLGLLMTGLAYHQYQMNPWWNQWNDEPPIVVPVVSD